MMVVFSRLMWIGREGLTAKGAHGAERKEASANEIIDGRPIAIEAESPFLKVQVGHFVLMFDVANEQDDAYGQRRDGDQGRNGRISLEQPNQIA